MSCILFSNIAIKKKILIKWHVQAAHSYTIIRYIHVYDITYTVRDAQKYYIRCD